MNRLLTRSLFCFQPQTWFSLVALTLVIMLINFTAMIPLGLGLIWTVPVSTIAFGVLYRNIFGCSQQTLADT